MSTKSAAKARVAALSRSRTPDDPELVSAREQLKGLVLEEYIRKAVDSAPPLTSERRDHLARLLMTSSAGEAA